MFIPHIPSHSDTFLTVLTCNTHTHPHMVHTLTCYTSSHAQLQSELDRALERNKELEERLNVAHIERREAQEERDAQVSKLYKEGERRKKVEKEVGHVMIM